MEPGTVIPMVRCEHNPELMAAINGLRDEYERAHQSALDWKATWEQTQDKLTEARLVLKHVLSELKQTSDWDVVDDLQAEIAAVLEVSNGQA